VIMGTAAYMPPEQARGQAVDRTADIWAYGCILYEMLTGRQPFAGDTLTDILASVVKLDPDWNALPEASPAAIQTLLRRCLTKDASRRLHSSRDARIEIDDALRAPCPLAQTPARVHHIALRPDARRGPLRLRHPAPG